jgi:hypothetical protein
LAAATRFDALSRFGGTFNPGKEVYDLANAHRGLAGRLVLEPPYGKEAERLAGIESWAFAQPRIPDYMRLLPPGPRQPEEFYFDWPHDVPVKKGTLTCELWRHRSDPEIFDFEVVFIGDGAARGVVECTVHAENLTQPARAIVKIARIVEPTSMADLANTLIEACG